MNVIFYSTHCPRCKVLETKMKAKNVEYVESNDIDEMIRLGLHSAPALRVDDKLMEYKEAINWVNSL